MKQIPLFKIKQELAFGGDLLKGKRKTQRPLARKRPLHLIFRAKTSTLRRHHRKIEAIWNLFAQQFGIKTYRLVICGNHIHSIVRIYNRQFYNRFAQAFTGTVSRRFKVKWLVRPFTRILSWGKEFRANCEYLIQNLKETLGEVPYRPRGKSRYPS